jgi:hypothetical protein
VTGYLARVEPGTGGKTLQHERHRRRAGKAPTELARADAHSATRGGDRRTTNIRR